jgi:hypothetical protein
LPEVPNFGAFVKVHVHNDTVSYGLIYNVAFADDPLIRQLVSAPDIPVETIRDMRENRQIPIEVSILIIGFQDGQGVHQYLPPQPPPALDEIEQCSPAEIVSLTARLAYFRTVLAAGNDIPADELLAASLREASRCHGQGQPDRTFLVKAGRELARLLNDDPVRLEGILWRIKP